MESPGKFIAEDLLVSDQKTRDSIGYLIVSGAPHILHEDSWVLLLVYALGTKRDVARWLKLSKIDVEDTWYERSNRKLLPKLKSSLEEQSSILGASDIHIMWEKLKRKIHEKDVDPGT